MSCEDSVVRCKHCGCVRPVNKKGLCLACEFAFENGFKKKKG